MVALICQQVGKSPTWPHAMVHETVQVHCQAVKFTGGIPATEFKLELNQISGYLFEIHNPHTGFELFRMGANYFKQL